MRRCSSREGLARLRPVATLCMTTVKGKEQAGYQPNTEIQTDDRWIAVAVHLIDGTEHGRGGAQVGRIDVPAGREARRNALAVRWRIRWR